MIANLILPSLPPPTGQSINDSYEGDKKIPFKSKNWRHKKMDFKDFKCIFDVLTPSSAKVSEKLMFCFVCAAVCCSHFHYSREFKFF